MKLGEEKRQIRQFATNATAVVTLSALIGAGSWWSASRIEEDLSRRARAALGAADIGALAHLTGREATLTGTVTSAREARTAELVVSDLWGIQQVTTSIKVVTPPARIPVAPPVVAPPKPDVWPEGSVGFASGRDDLTPSARTYLDAVAGYLKITSGIRVVIEGNSDNVGPLEVNRELSQRRSDIVAAYLVDHGVGAGRLRTVSYADTRPIASNGNAAGRSVNRRVALVFEETD
ncbi:MAG TPA: OmpA family protein [Kineosporiaceae bacterium]|nr:OmpA family protein [Kineosporiaceae bacterium]